MRMDVIVQFLFSSPLFWWGIGLSLFMVLVFLPGAVWILLRLPPDFLQRDQKPLHVRLKKGGFWYRTGLIFKNFFALVFILSGVLMLFLPGQGVLAILAGLILLDFPGKQKIERWIITQKAVRTTVNWLRRQYGQPELVIHESAEQNVHDTG